MKPSVISRLILLSLAGLAVSLPAQSEPARVPQPRGPAAYVLLAPAELAIVTALRAADDERVAATLAADPIRLDSIYSDELHYAHSNGVVDSKASFIESLTSKRTMYAGVDYVRREFIPAGPGITLMHGRAAVRVITPEGPRILDLNYLAVWREENGRWRFLAWQSSHNPAADKP